MAKVQNAKLFVGGLSPITSEQDLKEYFSKFGGIETIRLKTDPNTGNSKGFAFIVFSSEKSVIDVMSVDEHMIKNKKVDIEKAKVKQGKLFVAGLTSDLTDNDIRNHFSSYGKIVHADFPIDKTKNIRKTFCFITFETEKSVHDIIKNPKHMIKNQEVNVQQKNNRYDVNGGFQVKGFNDIINRGRQFNNTQTNDFGGRANVGNISKRSFNRDSYQQGTRQNNRHSSFQNNSMNHGQYQKTDMSQGSYQNNDMNQGQYQNNSMNRGQYQNNGMNQGQYQNNDMNQGRYQNNSMNRGQYQNNGMNQDRYQNNDMNQGQYQNNDMHQRRYQNNSRNQRQYQNNGMNQGRDQNNSMNEVQYQNNDMNQGRDQNNGINQGQYQNNNINQGRYQNSGMNQGQYQNNGMNQGRYPNNGMNQGRYQDNGMHQRQNQSNSGHGKWQTQRFQRQMPY